MRLFIRDSFIFGRNCQTLDLPPYALETVQQAFSFLAAPGKRGKILPKGSNVGAHALDGVSYALHLGVHGPDLPGHFIGGRFHLFGFSPTAMDVVRPGGV
jgi:hypothetical protein